ncbi:MAG: restriction endonuclease subunit S [Muribaculaceae bacterium]|nr:restriction endonuclease subunit S [Muribaculaceae bacterium]
MKHNWKYKHWNDVLKIFNGKNQKAVENPNGMYPIYGSGGILSYADDYICPENCTIIGRKGNINNPIFVPNKFWNVDTAFGLSPYEQLHPRFLFYFCQIYDFERHNKATTIPSLVKNDLLKIKMPVPPMEKQEQIVAELDQINDLIAKNRELLSQLDALAQSLFYDTFGDPIVNPKGWPIKKLSSVSKLINGRAYKQNELLDNGKYRVIRVGNFFTNSDYYYSNLELPAEKYIDDGDLIFAWSASFGAFIWRAEKVIYHYHIWKILFDEKTLNKIFYKFLLNEMTSSFMKDLHGIGMMHLTKAGMEQYSLPIPPLALQEDFAAKVEANEAQKAKVEAEIAELQTLLDARMDYWFN